MSRDGRKKRRAARRKLRAWLAANLPPPPTATVAFKQLFKVNIMKTKMILLDDIAPWPTSPTSIQN